MVEKVLVKVWIALLCLATTTQAVSVDAVRLDRIREEAKRATATTGSAYCSSSDGAYKLSNYTAPVQGSTPVGGSNVANFYIDDSGKGNRQIITGFGAAITDATVASIGNLSAALQTQLLQLAYNTTSGAGFGMIRHTIGSSDLTGDPAYTYDDSTLPDTTFANFGLTTRGQAMAAFIARLKGINPGIYTLGTSWSAPGWMKTNGKLVPAKQDLPTNTLSDKYSNSSQPDYSPYFATYFVKYLQAFQMQNVSIDAIAIQNEPLNNSTGYPTMFMNGSEAGGLIQNKVGPALANAGLTSTTIWGHEDNTNDITSAQAYLDIASQYVRNIAWHCYFTNTSGGPGLDWSALSTFHDTNKAKYPNLNLTQYMSECNTPAPEAGGHWWGAANFTMGPLQNWASGALSWTLSTNIYTGPTPTNASAMVTNYGPHLSTGGCYNCRGLFTVYNSTYYETNIAFYMLAQFSKFMVRGSTVVNTTGSTQIIDGVVGVQGIGAVTPIGQRVLVVLNTNSTALNVVLSTQTGETWSGPVPALSVVTWVLPATH